MSRRCELTGKKVSSGHNVSHSQRKTKRTWSPNLQKKRLLIPELNRTIQATLSTSAIRLINKYGSVKVAILKAKEENLSPAFKRLRTKLLAK